MSYVLELLWHKQSEYVAYFWNSLSEPHWHNWVYASLIVSLLVYALELMFPWRKQQSAIRKDFWLDGFYLVFNLFLFSLLGFEAVAGTLSQLFSQLRGEMGIPHLTVLHWPTWAQLLVMFVARDFLHYWIHRVMHAAPTLWEFHKVHHSVLQMGFAAHLRFHWMESVVYRGLEFIPLGLVGFGIQDFFAVHLLALTIGHLNHANVSLPLGPLRYLFNSPQMHIWHHAAATARSSGANFGLSLSVWDWIFRTAYWPSSGRDEALGFAGVAQFPSGFLGQLIGPFRLRKTR